jgi:hypothetical protein
VPIHRAHFDFMKPHRLATIARSGFVQRYAANNSAFPAGANDVVLYSRPLNLATFVGTLAVLRMQLEDLGAGINSFAVWRWPGRWRSTTHGWVRSQELVEELGYRISITPGYSGI